MPNSKLDEKMDAGLTAAFRAWQQVRDEGGQPDASISVSLRYEGDLASIEALGFETHMVSSTDEALGVVRFKDLPALVEHPGVLWLAAGRPRRKTLDTAARDIRARASSPVSGAPVDGLWHSVVSSGAFTNAANATGEDVIVAIIDTGIDYKHPLFMSNLTPPPKRTRILKIWDQGLVPTAVADCPNVARLASAQTYGVEYDKTEIEADLNGGVALRHRDCDGHGTHCAGIAAGGNIFATGGDASIMGAAPKASIIAVKMIDNPEHIFYRMPDNSVGAEVSWTLRFRDAVLYCLRTARDEFAKPVVVSMSFGNSALPGDALDDDSRFLDSLMDPGIAAGPDHFPRGAILVKSAGNEGDITDRQTARIVVPAAGQITIPFRLLDTRGTTQNRWDECASRLYKPTVGIHFWYRPAPAVLAVQFAVRVPNDGTFTANVSGGATNEIGYTIVAGIPPTVTRVAASPSVHRATVESETPAAVPHPSGTGSVTRHHMQVFVSPKETGGRASYNPGIYEVRITAPAGTTFFAMCEQEFWAAGKAVLFAVGTIMQDGTAAPAAPNLVVTNESSMTDSGGSNLITVAAYDDKDGTVGPTQGEIASFSSRGPLRNFSGPATVLPVIAVKPDIAAPGVSIMSADGIDTEPPPLPVVRPPSFAAGRRFTEKGGTSMSTPMVAGVIALMLHKKHDLNVTEARTALFTLPRAPVSPATGADATNAYGRGRLDAMRSHVSTP